MGEVGKFLFGGSSSDQSGRNSYFQQAQNSSQNTSAQASSNLASNYQKSGSAGYNQAYAPISAAMTPALGYVTQAGDMMSALLGLPPNTFSYKPTTYTPGPLMPSGGMPSAGSQPNLGALIDQITSKLPTPSTPPTPPPPPVPTVPTGPSTPGLGSLLGGSGSVPTREPISVVRRERGGPVHAGQPYLVGEKRPEIFVPQTNGQILPRANRQQQQTLPTAPTAAPAPSGLTTVSTQVNPAVNPTSALSNWSDSAGMNFLLDQGQKAISGASAANGVFNSGATGQALVQFGQDLGKTYLNDYMNHLLRYGQLGLGAGSALTGAGGVNQSQSVGGGTSQGVSAGVSQGSSAGSSIGGGSGTTSGSSSSKKGLF